MNEQPNWLLAIAIGVSMIVVADMAINKERALSAALIRALGLR